MAALRVLIVLASANRRGAELEGAELAKQLTARGLPTDVVALAPSSSDTAVGAEVIGRSPLLLSTLRELRRRARAADVVVAYGSSTLPACGIALVASRRPFIYRSIGDPAQWVRGRAHRLRTALLFHRAKLVVALWDEAAESIRAMYRLPADRVVVIPNARDGDRFHAPTETARAQARAALSLTSDARVVVFVGALSEEKRPLLAIEAVCGQTAATLVMAGDGPLRRACEERAAEYGSRCIVLGSVADVVPVLHAADALVLTSRTEGMPGSLIEALMCGLPVLATDVGAVRSLGDGIRVVPVNATPESIGAGLREIGRPSSGRPSVLSRFDWSEVVVEWDRVTRAAAV